jgi:hypothetical protein
MCAVLFYRIEKFWSWKAWWLHNSVSIHFNSDECPQRPVCWRLCCQPMVLQEVVEPLGGRE